MTYSVRRVNLIRFGNSFSLEISNHPRIEEESMENDERGMEDSKEIELKVLNEPCKDEEIDENATSKPYPIVMWLLGTDHPLLTFI